MIGGPGGPTTGAGGPITLTAGASTDGVSAGGAITLNGGLGAVKGDIVLKVNSTARLTVSALNGQVIFNQAILFRTTTALTNNAAAQIATLTNGPTAGNPTKWIPINDNGTTRNIPAW